MACSRCGETERKDLGIRVALDVTDYAALDGKRIDGKLCDECAGQLVQFLAGRAPAPPWHRRRSSLMTRLGKESSTGARYQEVADN